MHDRCSIQCTSHLYNMYGCRGVNLDGTHRLLHMSVSDEVSYLAGGAGAAVALADRLLQVTPRKLCIASIFCAMHALQALEQLCLPMSDGRGIERAELLPVLCF